MSEEKKEGTFGPLLDQLITQVSSPWFWIVPGGKEPHRTEEEDPFWMSRPVPPPPPDLDKPIEVRWLLPTIVEGVDGLIPAWTEWKEIPKPIEYGDMFEIGADPVIRLEEDLVYNSGRTGSTIAAQVRYTRMDLDALVREMQADTETG